MNMKTNTKTLQFTMQIFHFALYSITIVYCLKNYRNVLRHEKSVVNISIALRKKKKYVYIYLRKFGFCNMRISRLCYLHLLSKGLAPSTGACFQPFSNLEKYGGLFATVIYNREDLQRWTNYRPYQNEFRRSTLSIVGDVAFSLS